MKIRVPYSRLKQSELIHFNARVLDILQGCCGGTKIFENFKASAAALASLLAGKAHDKSTCLTELDREADMAWSAFNAYLKGVVMHPNHEIRQDAEKIYRVFSKTGNPTELNYTEEYGQLKILLSQLAELPSELFEKTHSEAYRKALEDATENFLVVSSEKIDAESRREIGALRDATLKCNKDWQNLVKYLELTAEVEANDDLTQAMKKLSYLCANLKRLLDGRKKGDDSAIDIASLPVTEAQSE